MLREGAFEDECAVWVIDKEGRLIWFYFFRDVAPFDTVFVENETIYVSSGSEYGTVRTVFNCFLEVYRSVLVLL